MVRVSLCGAAMAVGVEAGWQTLLLCAGSDLPAGRMKGRRGIRVSPFRLRKSVNISDGNMFHPHHPHHQRELMVLPIST